MVSRSDDAESPASSFVPSTWRLGPEDLPAGFVYPEVFTRVLARQLVDLDPWYFVEAEQLVATRTGLLKRYPRHNYVPFARRQDNDDIACWDHDPAAGVLIVHDWASAGYEINARYESFDGWFRRAVDDMLDWD